MAIICSTTSDKVQLTTSASANISVHVDFLENNAGNISASNQSTLISSATTTDILAAPSGSGIQRKVDSIFVRNTHASVSNIVTLKHTNGTTTPELYKATLNAGESFLYQADGSITSYDTFGQQKVSSPGTALVSLASDYTNSTTTASAVTGLTTPTDVGTYVFTYYLIHQSAATTTGIGLSVNHTGTVSQFVDNILYVDTSATASTGAPDQDEILSTAAVLGAFAFRAKSNAAAALTASVDTANADMFHRIEGITTVTVAGNLELWAKSEVAASQVTIKAGSSLIMMKTG